MSYTCTPFPLMQLAVDLKEQIELCRAVLPCDAGPRAPTGEEFCEFRFAINYDQLGSLEGDNYTRTFDDLMAAVNHKFPGGGDKVYWRVLPEVIHGDTKKPAYVIYMRLLITFKGDV